MSNKYEVYAQIEAFWNEAPDEILNKLFKENYIGKDRQKDYTLFNVENYTYQDLVFILAEIRKQGEK